MRNKREPTPSMQLRVHFYPAPEKERAIAAQYWQRDRTNFAHKPTRIAQQYGLKLLELNTLIKANSYAEMVRGVCAYCRQDISEIIYEQTSWKHKGSIYYTQCELCQNINLYQKYGKLKNREAVEVERNKLLKKKILLSGLCRSISEPELTLLGEIILYQGQLGAYIDQLPNPDFEELDSIVESLWEKKLLVEVGSRTRLPNKVVYDLRLEPIFRPLQLSALIDRVDTAIVDTAAVDTAAVDTASATPVSPNRSTVNTAAVDRVPVGKATVDTGDIPKEYVSFTLLPNPDYHTGQPDFSHTLLLQHDVILKKGTPYTLLGYRNSDGSVQISLSPRKELPENAKPQHLRDIIADFYTTKQTDNDH